jgi:hypothetical protein
MAERVAKAGEPWQTFFNPIDLDQTLQALGYSKIEDLDGP